MSVLVSGNSGHVDTSDIRDAYLSNLSADIACAGHRLHLHLHHIYRSQEILVQQIVQIGNQ